MFRITKDEEFDVWWIHKKFLFCWIKWSITKGNYVLKFEHIVQHLKQGKYEFGSGEYFNWWAVIDRGKYEQEFYKSVEDFIERNAEYII